MEKIRCYAQVSDGMSWSHYGPCAFKASVERDGKWYCKLHDPVRVEEKKGKRHKKWQEEWDADKEKRKRDAAMKQACEGVPTEVLEKIKVKNLLKNNS